MPYEIELLDLIDIDRTAAETDEMGHGRVEFRP
jgi:hypothetical protein